MGVAVGPRVLLPDEVELGNDAMVPTQGTIVAIGHFGSKGRIVTIYGSDEGPRFSIGCQAGKTFREIKHNVTHNTHTTRASANSYRRFLPVFSKIGRVVQKAYDREGGLIEELRSQRDASGIG